MATDRVLHRTFVRNGSDLVIPTTVETALTFDIEEYDTDGYHSNTVNPTKIVIPAFLTGWHLVIARVGWVGVVGHVALRRLSIRKNDAGATNRTYAATSMAGINLAKTQFHECSAMMYLASTDEVQVLAYHEEAGNETITTGTALAATGVQLFRLGAG